MYDDLVKRLRAQAVYLPEKFGKNAELLDVLMKAADAIEELQKAVNFHKFNSEFWEDKYNSLADEKWIPVTERLPENDTAVLAHVYWPEYGDTMICYGHWHKGWFHLFHHVEGELISGYVVTHWMPLPEPPKEEI